MTDFSTGSSTTVLERAKVKPKKPSMYQVILLNDEFTPREFVVYVLQAYFGKNETAAAKIMMTAHQSGQALVATYSYGVAETKVTKANADAFSNKFPLKFTMEPAD